jgi:hypothetical protein
VAKAVAEVTKAPVMPAAPKVVAETAAQASNAKPAPERKPEQTAESARAASTATSGGPGTGSHETYIERMKAAGYDEDLDKLIAMKIQNVTPEYAKAMAQVGLGKPTADELVACKIQGVEPETIAQLKQQGLEVKSFNDAVSYRIFQVTPEFVQGMKAAGFTNLDSKQLLNMRVQGVTPEYAKQVLQQFPGATADDLVQSKIFNINGDFIAQAKAHGFKDLTFKKLVQIRISGILDDEK